MLKHRTMRSYFSIKKKFTISNKLLSTYYLFLYMFNYMQKIVTFEYIFASLDGSSIFYEKNIYKKKKIILHIPSIILFCIPNKWTIFNSFLPMQMLSTMVFAATVYEPVGTLIYFAHSTNYIILYSSSLSIRSDHHWIGRSLLKNHHVPNLQNTP